MRVDQLVAKLQDRSVELRHVDVLIVALVADESPLRLRRVTRVESPADRARWSAGAVWYSVAVPHMSAPHLDSELKKGSAEFLILSLVEDRALHGYDIARLIDVRSKGALTFYAASLYPLLYRLERRGWITGRWLEQAGTRRRRMYRITAAGRRVLAAHRTTWDAFVRAVNLVTGTDHA
jgi:PadR family transcriptional regulator PadR